MKFLTLLWNWFNGNKTVIGMALMFLGDKTWFHDFAGDAGVDIVQYLGGILTSVGIVHKIAKADTTETPTA